MIHKLSRNNDVWLKLYDFEINNYLNQYNEPFRSTVYAIEMLKNCFDSNSAYRVLDIGTAGGANIHWLAKAFPQCEFVGIDISPDLIKIAKEMNKKTSNSSFYVMDMHDAYKLGYFDYVFSFQVLSWLEMADAREAFQTHCTNAGRGVFVSSLFCKDNIDYEIKVIDHYTARENYYNIYSIPSFNILCTSCGFNLKSIKEFVIDIDIPKSGSGLGTYTIKTETGQRLQFSGGMNMPWYFLYFERMA